MIFKYFIKILSTYFSTNIILNYIICYHKYDFNSSSFLYGKLIINICSIIIRSTTGRSSCISQNA